MKIKKAIGYILFSFSIPAALFFTYVLIDVGYDFVLWEFNLFIVMIATFFLTAYYSYYTSIATKKNPLEELDAEIYIIKKKIQNKKLLRKLEKLESENENNGDFKS